MYGKYTLFYESPKNGIFTYMHKQCVPGLSSGGGGGGGGGEGPGDEATFEYPPFFERVVRTLLGYNVAKPCTVGGGGGGGGRF